MTVGTITAIPCKECSASGKLLGPGANPHLPRTHPTQPGITCPYCNGLRFQFSVENDT